MKKLMSICGNWNMNFDEEYNEKEMWEGQIILSEDNWFEGIVKNNDDNEERMIMGFYQPQSYIELLKTIPNELIKYYLYHCDWTISGYKGEFSIINQEGELFCGSALITAIETEVLKQINYSKEKYDLIEAEINEETNELINRLNEFKMNNTVKKLYSNAIAMKEEISSQKTKVKVNLSDYQHIITKK